MDWTHELRQMVNNEMVVFKLKFCNKHGNVQFDGGIDKFMEMYKELYEYCSRCTELILDISFMDMYGEHEMKGCVGLLDVSKHPRHVSECKLKDTWHSHAFYAYNDPNTGKPFLEMHENRIGNIVYPLSVIGGDYMIRCIDRFLNARLGSCVTDLIYEYWKN